MIFLQISYLKRGNWLVDFSWVVDSTAHHHHIKQTHIRYLMVIYHVRWVVPSTYLCWIYVCIDNAVFIYATFEKLNWTSSSLNRKWMQAPAFFCYHYCGWRMLLTRFHNKFWLFIPCRLSLSHPINDLIGFHSLVW